MGYIVFQSRKQGQAVFFTQVLEDSTGSSDELAGFLPGDSVRIYLDIDQGLARFLQEKNGSTTCIQEKTTTQHTDLTQYEVVLNFRVLKRNHHVARDWMNRYKLGFRASGTAVHVEAETDEEEELFIQLQQQFDSQVDKLLLA